MRGRVRGGCAALTAAALVVSMAGTGAGAAGTKPKKQSAAKYAKTVCGTYTSFDTAIKAYADSINALDPSDPTAYQTKAAAASNTLLSAIQSSASKLTGAYPDVSDGKKVAALLNTRAATIQSSVTTAINRLMAAGANNPAVAVAQFSAAVTTLLATYTTADPFSKITDQSVLTAFQKQKSCKGIVQVFG